MNLNEVEIKDLESLLHNWLQSRGYIKRGMRAIVNVRFELEKSLQLEIENAPEITEPDQDPILTEIFGRMANGTRMANALFNNGIHTLKQLKNRNVSEILRLRNIGRKTLEEFQMALKSAGHEWHALDIFLSASFYRLDLDRCQPIKPTAKDWYTMQQAFKPEDVLMRRVLEKLEKTSNEPMVADKLLFKTAGGAPKLEMMRLINTRFKSRGLPYRLKIISVTPSARKLEGKVQIVALPAS